MHQIHKAYFDGFSEVLKEAAEATKVPLKVSPKGVTHAEQAVIAARGGTPNMKSAGAAQAIEAAAPKAEGLAEKLVATLRKKPIATAVTAAAAGAGVATGLEEAKEKRQDTERKREQVRELLMARLAGA